MKTKMVVKTLLDIVPCAVMAALYFPNRTGITFHEVVAWARWQRLARIWRDVVATNSNWIATGGMHALKEVRIPPKA